MLFRRASLPFRSIHTTDNHWMECPSILCQEAIFWACQLSKPGRTSLYLGMLTWIIFATRFPCSNISPLPLKLSCCTCLLCFPLTLGIQALPLLLWRTVSLLPKVDISAPFTNILPHVYLEPLEPFDSSSDSLSPSESVTKSLTASVVISAAERAACSLRNYTKYEMFIYSTTFSGLCHHIKSYLHYFVSCTTCFSMLQPLLMPLKGWFAGKCLEIKLILWAPTKWKANIYGNWLTICVSISKNILLK